jgi:hypothetical protein
MAAIGDRPNWAGFQPAAGLQPAPQRNAGMMGQVQIAPQRLWNAQQRRKVPGEQTIGPAVAEKGAVNEIMGDGIRIPPHAQSDHRPHWPDHQNQTVQQS